MKKAAPQSAAPAPTLTVGLNRCPYCHDGVLVDRTGWLACSRCLARHHTDCWAESDTCGACGHDACLRQTPPAKPRRVGRNGLVGALALVLFVAGGIIVGLTDGPAQAPPPESLAQAANPDSPPVTLGVVLQDAPGVSGALVYRVYIGGPAQLAGVKPGHVIQSVDGAPFRTAADLRAALDTHQPGDTLRLGILTRPKTTGHRSQRSLEAQLVASVPDSLDNAAESRAAVLRILGLRVTTMPEGGWRSGPVFPGGIMVQEVLPGAGSPLVAADDFIESVDGRPVATTRQLRRLLSSARWGDTLRLGLRHPYGDGSVVSIQLPD